MTQLLEKAYAKLIQLPATRQDEIAAQILAAIDEVSRETEPATADAPPKRPSFLGKYAHLPGSVDDFLRRKQEDIELEYRRYE
jgi:hypothetical protein